MFCLLKGYFLRSTSVGGLRLPEEGSDGDTVEKDWTLPRRKEKGWCGACGISAGKNETALEEETEFQEKKKETLHASSFNFLNALQLYENLMQGWEHTDNLGWFGLVSLHLYLPFCYLWNNSFLYPSWSLCIWLSWQPRLHEDDTFRLHVLIFSNLYKKSEPIFFFLLFSPPETSKQPVKFPFCLKISNNIKGSFLFRSQVDACYCLAKETNC